MVGMSVIAGVNSGGHDAAAALLIDGQVVACIEQERLSRVKRAPGESPAAALRWCLDSAGLSLREVDTLAIGADHKLLSAVLSDPGLPSLDAPERLFPSSLFGGQRPENVVSVRHHVAHAASAFYLSGFSEAAVLVVDAMGEECATSLGVGSDSQIDLLETFPVDTSLGYFYEAAALYAGFDKAEGGKLMGLASYGRRSHPLSLFSNGALSWPIPRDLDGTSGKVRVRRRRRRLQEWFAENFYPFASRDGDSELAYVDFAATVQSALEEALLQLARRSLDLTQSRNLVVAGGVGLNCSANGRLSEIEGLDGLFVQPMAHDAGVSLGAALAVAAREGEPRSEPMQHAYLGAESSQEEVREAVVDFSLRCLAVGDEAISHAARIIAQGGIVAWHTGRAEVGPRALGARSLLGNPGKRETLVRLNTAKRREMWRPLAPSVQEESFHDYFEGTPNPFMIVAARVRDEVQSRLPAITHVDGSARPQAVSSVHNPPYHQLLGEMKALTGFPIVVNTSLNVQGEPIASSARDSARAGIQAGADAVYLDGRLYSLQTAKMR